MNAPWRWPLHWQILVGLLIGGLIGWGLGASAVADIPASVAANTRGAAGREIIAASLPFQVLDLLGDIFLQGLKLVIVPLVTTSIVMAVAGLGGAGFGRLGAKTMLYYASTSLVAILTGMFLVTWFQPGIVDGKGILVGKDLGAFAVEQAAVTERVGGRGASAFLDVFREMVPENVFAAATNNGDLLGLVIVSLLVGMFLSRLPDAPRKAVTDVIDGIYRITMLITGFVLMLAPIGIGALVASTVAEQWATLSPDGRFADLLAGVFRFAMVAFVALCVHMLVVMPLVLALVARVRPDRHFRAMAPALVTAFSTSSSSATLPVTIDCVENRAGVSNQTASFVLPLGATVNMDGTALYECVAAVFICQAFGVDLPLSQQFFIVVIALLTSIGVAGVPSASLVAIAVILEAVDDQLPAGALPDGVALMSGMALLFVFDRPLDMLRTMVNIFGDSVGAIVVARSEGETDVLTG